MNGTEAGWHPDPSGKHDHRWWDGHNWTDQVADAGVNSTDPMSAPPPGGAVAQAAGGVAALPQAHEVDYFIGGDDLQYVEVELDPGETVIGEAGSMMFLEQAITFETKMGDGSDPDAGLFKKMKSAGKRFVSQESVFLTHFTNAGHDKQRVAFAAEFPGKIIPMNLAERGGELLCQKDAFLAAALGTEIDIAFQKKLGAGFFGGEGFILQKLRGDGYVFMSAGGTIVERELTGQTLRVDTGCIVAFEPQIQYDIERAGNLKSMVFGGEGLFLASLSGYGKVWLQSLPASRLANHIMLASGGGSGEGSLLNNLSSLSDLSS